MATAHLLELVRKMVSLACRSRRTPCVAGALAGAGRSERIEAVDSDRSPSPLADTNPFPDTIGARLRQQLTFLVEVDRLKTVLRQSPLAAADR
jgi:hypothetical protein